MKKSFKVGDIVRYETSTGITKKAKILRPMKAYIIKTEEGRTILADARKIEIAKW